MSELRRQIIAWVRAKGIGSYWLLDLFRHLTKSGASPEDALAAMSLFIEEAIALKSAQQKEPAE